MADNVKMVGVYGADNVKIAIFAYVKNNLAYG